MVEKKERSPNYYINSIQTIRLLERSGYHIIEEIYRYYHRDSLKRLPDLCRFSKSTSNLYLVANTYSNLKCRYD